jgi:hypothetical protein
MGSGAGKTRRVRAQSTISAATHVHVNQEAWRKFANDSAVAGVPVYEYYEALGSRLEGMPERRGERPYDKVREELLAEIIGDAVAVGAIKLPADTELRFELNIGRDDPGYSSNDHVIATLVEDNRITPISEGWFPLTNYLNPSAKMKSLATMLRRLNAYVMP